ncbi:MAG TPA: hypothetical protein VL305_02035 [Pseudolabrys sp.]|jgi:hypothetical protein|nr:hypothetical protein [Pseudolabrys sp.]
MRMPLFSYFVVMGPTLALALIYICDRIEPHGSPVPTSQIAGIAKPFKPEPERSPYTITGTNFAAAYKPVSARAAAEPKPSRRADSLPQQQPADAGDRNAPRWKAIAQNPIDALMSIH